MNEFKFLQTSDLHVGRGRASWGAKAALARSARLFDVLYATAKEHGCNAVVIAGDVFDAKDVTNRERELVVRKLSKYAGKDGIPTFITPGNHDLISRKASNLDFLAEVTENTREMPRLHVAFAREVSLWRGVAPGLSFIGVPAAVSESKKKLEQLTLSLDKASSYVLIGHGLVRGSVNDAGYAPSSGKLSLRRAAQQAPQIVWWAFGDVHTKQRLPTLPKGAHGWYAGSPIQMNFGEEPGRGCFVVTLRQQEAASWAYAKKKFVRLDDKGFTPLVTVRNEEELASVPPDAFIRLARGLRLPSQRRAQLISTLKVVEDLSTPVISDTADEMPAGVLRVFDPLLASTAEIEQTVIAGLSNFEHPKALLDEAKLITEHAVERFRQRIYLS